VHGVADAHVAAQSDRVGQTKGDFGVVEHHARLRRVEAEGVVLVVCR
jgi:hypothetical protein